MRRVRVATVLAAAAMTTLLVIALPVGPAGAHGANGTLGVEATPGSAPLTARVRALLEYANDREVAPGATVTAEARDPAGRVVGPQPMADQGRGLYETTLTLPAAGTWTIAVAAVDPAAVAQTTITVVEGSAVTTVPTTRAPIAARPDSQARGTAPADDGVSAVVIVGIILVVAIAVGGAAMWARRRAAQ
jgi:hypothetical protein